MAFARQCDSAIGFDNFWVLAMLVPFYFVIRHGVVAREEVYLERKFGGVYLGYKTRVRRWLRAQFRNFSRISRLKFQAVAQRKVSASGLVQGFGNWPLSRKYEVDRSTSMAEEIAVELSKAPSCRIVFETGRMATDP